MAVEVRRASLPLGPGRWRGSANSFSCQTPLEAAAVGRGTVTARSLLGIGRTTGYPWRAENGGLPPVRLAESSRSSRFLSLLKRQWIAALRGRGPAYEIARRVGRSRRRSAAAAPQPSAARPLWPACLPRPAARERNRGLSLPFALNIVISVVTQLAPMPVPVHIPRGVVAGSSGLPFAASWAQVLTAALVGGSAGFAWPASASCSCLSAGAVVGLQLAASLLPVGDDIALVAVLIGMSLLVALAAFGSRTDPATCPSSPCGPTGA
jgi:hypothetical protein